MKVNFKFSPNKTQQKVLELLKENDVVVANVSRQQGKSYLARYLAVFWALQNPCIIAYVTPTLKLAKKFFKDFHLPPEIIKSYNGSEYFIEFVNGSQLWFYSSEQADKIRGITLDYLILDEIAFYKDGEYLYYGVLQPTLKVRGKKTLIISTPNGKDNIFYKLYNSYPSITKTIYDDSYCKDIEAVKRNTPEIIFKQEYLCQFLDNTGTFFQGFKEQEFTFDTTELYFGLDLSSVGKDETILTLINKKLQVTQYVVKGTLDVKYKQIADIINKYDAKGYAEQNSIGEPMINEIVKLLNKPSNLRKWLTNNKSKTTIISKLAIKLPSIIYNDKELTKQLNQFQYKILPTGTMTFQGLKDDRVMSLAIALQALEDLTFKNDYIFL